MKTVSDFQSHSDFFVRVNAVYFVIIVNRNLDKTPQYPIDCVQTEQIMALLQVNDFSEDVYDEVSIAAKKKTIAQQTIALIQRSPEELRNPIRFGGNIS
jgi:hypothetical protein